MEIGREAVDLLLRWVHVIAAIMWMGNSMLFNWLDRNLKPGPTRPTTQGHIWLLHSGAFYEVEKMLSPGETMPRPLHWFKWQAYTTWLTGAALLIVVYYMGGGGLLLGVREGLTPTTAIALAAGTIVFGFLAYEALWRSPLARHTTPLAALSFLLLIALAFALTRVFPGRAAFLHVGALLGTLMAGNVFTKIMPAQRQMVAAVARGPTPDARLSHHAKLRSIHNNYMSFPVVVLMMSSHFPAFHSGPRAWLVLAALVLAGAAVRHILNIRFDFAAWRPALAITIAAGVAALFLLVAPPRPTGAPASDLDAAVVSPAQAHAVIAKRCTVCHSADPADRSFGVAPGGVMFDTPAQIDPLAPRIELRAVTTRTMPPANSTHMTEAERALLARWAAQQR
jgi:uncharacterized membrane protein